jgi:hypothetical protein
MRHEKAIQILFPLRHRYNSILCEPRRRRMPHRGAAYHMKLREKAGARAPTLGALAAIFREQQAGSPISASRFHRQYYCFILLKAATDASRNSLARKVRRASVAWEAQPLRRPAGGERLPPRHACATPSMKNITHAPSERSGQSREICATCCRAPEAPLPDARARHDALAAKFAKAERKASAIGLGSDILLVNQRGCEMTLELPRRRERSENLRRTANDFESAKRESARRKTARILAFSAVWRALSPRSAH